MVIQKNVEIGVSNIIPVMSERSEYRVEDSERVKRKLERWQKIATEAAKQSMRNKIPSISPIIGFDEMLNQLLQNKHQVIVPYENATGQGIKNVVFKQKYIDVIIGPEGGFEEEEIGQLRNLGANIVTLGNRILRTETAGLIVNALILSETDDLG